MCTCKRIDREMMAVTSNCCVRYEHLNVDGRAAVLELVAMKEALDDPARLLFDI